MVKYLVSQELDRELRINKGLAGQLMEKATGLHSNPKDAEKAKELLVALYECRHRLARLLADTERLLRASASITRHVAHDAARSSLHGSRGHISGNAKQLIAELRYHLDKLDAAIGLAQGMNSKPAERLRSTLELIEDITTNMAKAGGSGYTGVPEYRAPDTSANADPAQALGTALVLLAVLITKWTERVSKQRP